MKKLLPFLFFSLYTLSFLAAQQINSVLNEGEIYKLTVKETGIYKLDKAFFDQNNINLASLNPKNIKIFGNGGGTVPELITSFRIEDLAENPILVNGEADGNFDEGDYVLFYGQGPDVYHDANQSFNHYNKIIRYERDLINLLGAYSSTHGTGQRWFGDILTNETTKDFSSFFNIPNIVPNTNLKIKSVLAARSNREAEFNFNVNNGTFSVRSNHVDIADIEDPYADLVYFEVEIGNLDRLDNFRVSFDKEGVNIAEAWIDFIEVNAVVPNRYSGEAYHFSVESSIDNFASEYNINSAIALDIWDVTEPHNVKFAPTDYSDNTVSFVGNTDFSIRNYVAFNSGSNTLQPLL